MCNDREQWNAFVEESPHGNVFCRSTFLDAMGEQYELLVVREGGRITLGAILILRDGQVLGAPYPLTMYQGVLCCGDFDAMPSHRQCPWLQERVGFLLSEIGKRHSHISFCLSHRFRDIRSFQWFHYHEPALGMFSVQVRFTGLLPVHSFCDFDTYLTQVRTVRRQEYRKAQRLLDIEQSTDVDLLNRLHGITFARQSITRSTKDEERLVRISTATLQHGFGELLVCRDKQGNPASATLFLRDHRTAYYLIGASDPKFRKSGAGTLLVMENIRRAFDRGVCEVDFVGINSPNRGDFKTSFNASPMPYYVLDYVRGN